MRLHVIHIEPFSLVVHGDKYPVGVLNQSDLSSRSSAVFLQVLKGFLNDTEQTQSHVRIDNTGDFVG